VWRGVWCGVVWCGVVRCGVVWMLWVLCGVGVVWGVLFVGVLCVGMLCVVLFYKIDNKNWQNIPYFKLSSTLLERRCWKTVFVSKKHRELGWGGIWHMPLLCCLYSSLYHLVHSSRINLTIQHSMFVSVV
jgi:hypothetical protein